MIKQLSALFILPIISFFLLSPMILYSDDDVATALYKEGLKKYILEDFNGAIEDFDSALRLNPDDSKIKKMYINTLIKQGNFEYENNNLKTAEEYFLKAYTLSGEDKALQKNLKMIQEQIKEREKIIETKAVERVEEVTETAEIVKEEVRPAQLEVTLPFDMDKFIQQQNEENKKVLDELIKAQKEERERLHNSISESQKLLDENIRAQKTERESLYKNMAENRTILDENIRLQKDERESLYKNIEESRKLLDENISSQKVERETLIKSIQDNQKLLKDNIKSQRDERESFLKNMMIIAQSQREDRKLFSRSIMTIVGGAIVITVLIFLGFIVLLRRRYAARPENVYYEPPTSLGFKQRTLLEYADKIDETNYITDDSYSEVVRAKRLGELYGELQQGNLSWDVIQSYISELNHEIKSEILSIVEKKVKSGDKGEVNNALEILLPFITDGDEDIGNRSKGIVKGISGNTGGYIESEEQLLGGEEMGDTSDPLSMGSLLPMAKMVDTKTGRANHSLRVADISFRIAQILNDPELDPSVVRRVALVHDIGYLEIADTILRKDDKLTERQFSIIKTHAEKGLHLFQHVDLPKIFIDGIKYHHERLDGSGYPDGLDGEDIPLIARVLAVADFFDAVTSVRPHRPALTIKAALGMMGKLAGDVFDMNIFNILVEIQKDQMDDEV